jgi:hypothetical protein
MDAASCFILGNAFVPTNESEPSQLEALRLLKAGWTRHKMFPSTLFVPIGQFKTNLPEAAKRQGIDVIPVDESQLLVFISDAKESFREYVQREVRPTGGETA